MRARTKEKSIFKVEQIITQYKGNENGVVFLSPSLSVDDVSTKDKYFCVNEIIIKYIRVRVHCLHKQHNCHFSETDLASKWTHKKRIALPRRLLRHRRVPWNCQRAGDMHFGAKSEINTCCKCERVNNNNVKQRKTVTKQHEKWWVRAARLHGKRCDCRYAMASAAWRLWRGCHFLFYFFSFFLGAPRQMVSPSRYTVEIEIVNKHLACSKFNYTIQQYTDPSESDAFRQSDISSSETDNAVRMRTSTT